MPDTGHYQGQSANGQAGSMPLEFPAAGTQWQRPRQPGSLGGFPLLAWGSTAAHDFPPALFDAPHPKADQPQVPSGTALRGRVSGPVQVLAKLKTSWDLSEAELAILLGFEDVRLVRDLLSGVTSLRGPDMKARFRYLFWIYEALFQLFEDEATERAWLRKSAPGLEGKSPIQVMLQGEIEDLLTVKQFVEYVAGR